jgi:hypothetical protein
LAYNIALTNTNNQQTLMAVIQNRYDEVSNLLTVASITANVRVTTRADVQLGIGGQDNYAGNLVPFSAAAIYEENPTISYTPVAGSRYMRQLMAPTHISKLAQLSATRADPGPIYRALISSVNGIRNPDFLYASVEPDPRFERFVALIVDLSRRQRLHWAADSAHPDKFFIVLNRESVANASGIEELLDLLGLPRADENARTIRLPVSMALDARDSGGIGITTRSVYQLSELMSAAVELPERDLADGVVGEYPPVGPVARQLRIRRTDGRPDKAVVAVPYRDGWFYIDDKDLFTKRFFRIMVSLWSAAIADTTVTSSSTPLLTVPVSR